MYKGIFPKRRSSWVTLCVHIIVKRRKNFEEFQIIYKGKINDKCFCISNFLVMLQILLAPHVFKSSSEEFVVFFHVQIIKHNRKRRRCMWLLKSEFTLMFVIQAYQLQQIMPHNYSFHLYGQEQKIPPFLFKMNTHFHPLELNI